MLIRFAGLASGGVCRPLAAEGSIVEIDLNPVIARPRGAVAVDALGVLEPMAG